MKQLAHRFPDVTFSVKKDPETVADKIYLGLFLALCLFFAFLFGNLLFTLIVAILSVFIMLSYDTDNILHCLIARDFIAFGKEQIPYEDIRYFNIVENSLDRNKEYIKISFRNYLRTNQYIPLPENVQKETIYAILSAKLDESPAQNLSFVEMLMLRFFKW